MGTWHMAHGTWVDNRCTTLFENFKLSIEIIFLTEIKLTLQLIVSPQLVFFNGNYYLY